MTVLLDSHALLWWSQDSARLSERARALVEGAGDLAVCGVTWYELAWLAGRGRIVLGRPVDTWLAGLAEEVRTAPLTWSVARTAAALPESFPGDPADRLIYATAVENGWQVVTKDRRMHDHPAAREVAVW